MGGIRENTYIQSDEQKKTPGEGVEGERQLTSVIIYTLCGMCIDFVEI